MSKNKLSWKLNKFEIAKISRVAAPIAGPLLKATVLFFGRGINKHKQNCKRIFRP